jgi:hypothetical protein
MSRAKFNRIPSGTDFPPRVTVPNLAPPVPNLAPLVPRLTPSVPRLTPLVLRLTPTGPELTPRVPSLFSADDRRQEESQPGLFSAP